MKSFKRYTVTAALPYANGPVHIGHLAGVYVPADIYVRYLRLRGRDVLYICGSDEHGVPITIKARNDNVSPQKIVDHYHKVNKRAFEEFGIYDYGPLGTALKNNIKNSLSDSLGFFQDTL